MLHVSRTPVNETWLSALPLSSKNHQALGAQAVIKIEDSRFSVSTINTDLFPELLSWSAMMSTQPTSPHSQFPSDVSKPSDSDTVMEVSISLSAVFDPTTLDFGFDPSCLNGLDDTLIYSPLSAFSDACWADMTGHSHSEHASTSTSIPLRGGSRRRRARSPLVTSSSSDESDTDSDECKTFDEEDTSQTILGNGLSSGLQTVGEFSSDIATQSLYFSDGNATSFMFFESRFAAPDPKESVGFFPTRAPQHRKTMSTRIAAFCSHLPASLTFVRAPAP
ncbi:hypothetical protein GALMADRAFT_268062 [Galerina marginata CBS 339.88]|uniref:Uncharacterized protein n=1 Tax=Galerina marginata (strain CBS 339.88) TaxID=685588 RepID=A0A067T6F8_GALM3|nr:hypothetical protein GALMADRAFT_268062 [Galerina marginata CBS 339.88]